jgi:hypothetical protein
MAFCKCEIFANFLAILQQGQFKVQNSKDEQDGAQQQQQQKSYKTQQKLKKLTCHCKSF